MAGIAALALVCGPSTAMCAAADPSAELMAEAEQARIRTVESVALAVVCIYDSGRRGGGSGVIINADGYGLTNFHVVAGMLHTRRGLGGLANGKLYELEVLGIDPTGDVAMFRLMGEAPDDPVAAVDDEGHPRPFGVVPATAKPREAVPPEPHRFAFAPLGDSDAVKVGDFALAMGNPFVLSEDQTPTVTMGIVTGVHRYQWGAGGNTLLYSDCLQTDAPINPGNSGGPLFNLAGEVIGINGRISVGQRGRFNVGFGYAISINQIKRFMPSLRAGLLAQHGLLQATVNQDVVFNDILEDAPGWGIGIRPGDKLLRFGGQEIVSANHFASLLYTYPANWPVAVSFQSGDKVLHRIARLEPLRPKLPKPFEPDVDVNRREAIRVLEQFRRTVSHSDGAPAGPMRWVVQSSRQRGETSDRRETIQPPDGPANETVRDEQGNLMRRVEFDQTGAWWLGENDRFEAPLDEALAYRAIYALRHHVLGATAIEPERISHAGGDALVRLGDGGELIESTLLETVMLKVGDHATASLQFAYDDHLLRRVIVRDQPTGFEVTLTIDEYANDGAIRYPTVTSVESNKGAYREVVTKMTRELQ